MTTAHWYGNALANSFGSGTEGNSPNIDFLSDDIRMALLASSYTPDLDAHDFWNDASADEVSGTGYTANGEALASKTLTVTAADSWGTTWAASTAYSVGDIIRPTSGNGYVYRCVVAGTSGGSEPTFSTVAYQTTTDNTVTWATIGVVVIQFDAANVSWASSTITARYAIIYDRTPATDATRPLIWLIDFESDQSTTNGTFQVNINSLGLGVMTSF